MFLFRKDILVRGMGMGRGENWEKIKKKEISLFGLEKKRTTFSPNDSFSLSLFDNYFQFLNKKTIYRCLYVTFLRIGFSVCVIVLWYIIRYG